jgi:hypothetical protein
VFWVEFKRLFVAGDVFDSVRNDVGRDCHPFKHIELFSHAHSEHGTRILEEDGFSFCIVCVVLVAYWARTFTRRVENFYPHPAIPSQLSIGP